MKNELIDEMIAALRERLLSKRPADGAIWRGELSSSAISTSVAIFALHMVDSEKYAPHIQQGKNWLTNTMLPGGSWGDSAESPANMTATLLTYASLCAVGTAPQKTKEYLAEKFGGTTDQHIVKGVLSYYGKDLTFSVPILVMCALAGVISSWEKIPQLPFELSVLPQKLFRFLRLPVVSYAIPALIAVGILRYKKGRKNILSPLRKLFIKKSLRVLEKLQPSNGGFLEAAPLTAFVTMCMCGAGYREHTATQLGASFLAKNVRADGSWPIDTDLACWVTALSVRALGNDSQQSAIGNWQSLPTANCQLPICNLELTAQIKRNAFAFPHPFTGAKEGGWAWTDLPGAVPDADDTAGALVALHTLSNGKYCYEVGKGIEWLLALQNSDGGMPTFCKGWGKLPFDRSSPDISAHAILAFQLWQNALPDKLQKKCRKSTTQMLRWMHRAQAADGSWTPLWFGDQDAPDERAPVYGTAMATEYLSATSYQLPVANNTLVYPQEFGHWSLVTGKMVSRGLQYLLAAQNADGGWGGAKGIPSKVTFTARALSAIASVTNVTSDKRDMSLVARHSSLITATQRAFDFLHQKYKAGELYRREPIGLYFSRLWYSEELYNISFVLNALKKLEACSKAN